MNKNINIILAAILICFVTLNCFAEVTKIIDEKDVLKVSGQYSATPAGLAKTSYGTFIFFEKSTGTMMEYNPADKQLNIIADEDSIKSAMSGKTAKQKKSDKQKPDAFRRPTTLCFDLDVDAKDNIYAIVADKADSNQVYAIQMNKVGDKFNLPEKIAKVSERALCVCQIKVDDKRSQLVILMDTYKGADDPKFNGIYTLGIAGNNAGLKCFKSFGQIGEKVSPMLIAGDKPIGGTGLAIQGDNLYWHLTVGPANGHGADGDLVMINLKTGKVESALDRERFINDIGPEGLGQDGNFYFTTFDIDGQDLFMMVNVGVTDRTQNIHHWTVDGNEFVYKGVAAYEEEILQAGHLLGMPLIVYSTECEAKDGKFYIFTGSNLVENLLQIAPDYNDPPVVRVAVYSGPGGDGFSVFDALKTHPDIYVKKVSPKEIRQGILKDFDVIIQPGGSGSGQGKALGEVGCKAVKDFVKEGHGYIGICAGAYLASSGYEWSLGMMNAIVLEREHWNRGGGDLAVELTSEGRRIICDMPGTVEIRYGQGALYAPAGRTDLPEYRVLAYYRETTSELTNAKESVNGAVEGVMNGVPAIATAEYGKGRVVTISPHPESKGSGLEFFIHNLARFVAKAKPTHRADMLDKPQQDCVRYVQRNYQKPANTNAQQVCK